ncbi:MAG TPA: hypothetical protein VHX38_33265 [Pseudonocardiaceae bacterium]|jgi:hypothetical protein|nr:hypothetical protein [Pseudonocardiaceae bacterium]
MREIEFAELGGDPAARDDGVHLAGRCYQGPILVGDVFVEAVTADGKQEIALRLDQVLLYGRPSDELDPGLTAEITLSGEGLQHVKAGVLLRGQVPDS